MRTVHSVNIVVTFPFAPSVLHAMTVSPLLVYPIGIGTFVIAVGVTPVHPAALSSIADYARIVFERNIP
jgi:hypothetical protein